jgi:hypothetical protein
VCACQLDLSANLLDHHGELFVQSGPMVDL